MTGCLGCRVVVGKGPPSGEAGQPLPIKAVSGDTHSDETGTLKAPKVRLGPKEYGRLAPNRIIGSDCKSDPAGTNGGIFPSSLNPPLRKAGLHTKGQVLEFEGLNTRSSSMDFSKLPLLKLQKSIISKELGKGLMVVRANGDSRFFIENAMSMIQFFYVHHIDCK